MHVCVIFPGAFFCLCNVLSLSLLSFTLSSLFVWSNETMNIWTHLLGLIYFFYLLIYDNFSLLEDSHSDFGDNLTFTLMDSAFMVRDSFTLSLYLCVLFFLCPDLHVLFRIFSSFQLHIRVGEQDMAQTGFRRNICWSLRLLLPRGILCFLLSRSKRLIYSI